LDAKSILADEFHDLSVITLQPFINGRSQRLTQLCV
jgi:hypothetical protein